MRIAVDLDDVLADLISCLLETHLDETGHRLDREQAVDWGVFPPAVHDRIRYDGGYRDLAPLPEAPEFLGWLRDRGDRVFIVTYRGQHARPETEAWLDRYVGDLYEDLRMTGGSKVDACRELAVDLIVDDSARQVPAVTSALKIPGILMDTPMNRHIVETDLIRRAHTLSEARQLVELFRPRAGES